MHVGSNKGKCAELKANDKPMENVKEISYLGDVVSEDCKNTSKGNC